MRIILSGPPGSGKSTAARKISNELSLKHYSMGDFQRELAREKGITINELSKLEEKDPSIDRMVDEKQKKLGLENDSFILDSRLGALFIPHAEFKIFIDCDIDERARRIHGHGRYDEEGELDDIKVRMIEREKSEEKRFRELYKFDYKEKKHYNIFVDSTHMKEEEVFKMIINKIKPVS